MRHTALETYLRDVRLQVSRAVNGGDASGHTSGTAREHTSEDSGRRGSLDMVRPVMVECAKAWQEQRRRWEEESSRLARDYRRSAYLNRVPQIPSKDEASSHHAFQADLDRAVARVLQLPGRGQVSADDRLAAVHKCLTDSHRGLWQELIPDDFSAVPGKLPEYFDMMINRVRESLYAVYYDHISIDELLREMPADHVRWCAGARHSDVETDLESPHDSTRENAKRGVLVEELFNHTVLPLPLAGVHAEGFFWLSGSPSEDGDYLLREPGLNRQVGNGHCDFTNDRATAVLLAYRRGLRPADVLESSGSLYRKLLDRVRQQFPNQPDLAPVPESLTGGDSK